MRFLKQKSAIMQTEVLTYLKKHWFKTTLVAIFIFVAFKKDLSFQINVNTPVPRQEIEPEPPVPIQSVKDEPRQETLTENTQPAVEVQSSSVIDRFKFSPLGRSQKNKATAYEKLSAVDEEVIAAYVKRFTRVAVMEQEKFGIPASIILGNALLMSRAGKNELSVEGNNHFALACTKDWQGDSGGYDAKCMRHYENAWTSFRDHSLYLTTGEMGFLLSGLSNAKYKDWARALGKSSIQRRKELWQATDPGHSGLSAL
jgi:flagellum-specific peptidoglycan hydrolase FlgJ